MEVKLIFILSQNDISYYRQIYDIFVPGKQGKGLFIFYRTIIGVWKIRILTLGHRRDTCQNKSHGFTNMLFFPP